MKPHVIPDCANFEFNPNRPPWYSILEYIGLLFIVDRGKDWLSIVWYWAAMKCEPWV